MPDAILNHERAVSDAYPKNEPEIIRFTERRSENWHEIQRRVAVYGYSISEVTCLLRSGLDPFLGAVVIEPRYVCKDHSSLHEHFYSKKFVRRTGHCLRLHFFSSPDIDARVLLLEPQSLQNSYIGLSVIRPIKGTALGRTIIDPEKIGRGVRNNYFVLRTSYKAHLFGAPLEVEGFPFHANDDDAMLCGHVALWSICRYLSERRTRYAEMLPYKLLSLSHHEQGRLLPGRPTDFRDYSSILLNFGTHPVVLRTAEGRTARGCGDPAFRDICAYIESGVPILISLTQHADRPFLFFRYFDHE